MALNADTLIDRSHLKGQIAKWRIIAIAAIVLSVVFFTERLSPITPHGKYIARVNIEGIIVDDILRDEFFQELQEDEGVRAVILRVDSPGGTVVGGEQLYLNVKSLAEVKPVVVVMRSLATSAGYMATLGANRIYARKGTVTGSIGVLMQSAEFTGMANKMGVEPIIIKSGENKAAPNPLEKLSEENREVMQTVVNNFFNTFVDMVVTGRNMEREAVLKLADGRVFTGPQALEAGLIDALGGEEEALEWLRTEKKLDAKLEVEDRAPRHKGSGGISDVFGQISKLFSFLPQIRLDGLVSIWQPRAF